MELPLANVILGTILPEVSGATFGRLDVWACLVVNPLNIPRTPYWASEEEHSKPTMSYHPTLTSSAVYHSSYQWTAPFLSYNTVPEMTIDLYDTLIDASEETIKIIKYLDYFSLDNINFDDIPCDLY